MSDDLQKVYDIQFNIELSLNKAEAEILLVALEEYGLQAHSDATHTGESSYLKTVDTIDNIVSMISYSMAEQESAVEKEVDFQNESKWFYTKGG